MKCWTIQRWRRARASCPGACAVRLAADLRVVLRERLAAGESDAQAVDYLVARYGEFILLRPDTSGANRVLWAAGPLLFLSALFIGWRTVRRRPEPVVESLSAAEQAKLDKILRN